MIVVVEWMPHDRRSRRDIQYVLKQRVQRLRRVLDGAFGGVGDEEVVVGEGVVVISSSLEMLTNSCLGGIMVSLIFLEGFEEEAFVEFMEKECLHARFLRHHHRLDEMRMVDRRRKTKKWNDDLFLYHGPFLVFTLV
ncbi:hypothetical protein Tco_0128491 [Tanacetum coccineum]